LETLVVGSREVSGLMSMKDCIEVMRQTFLDMGKGEVVFPPRWAMPQPGKRGLLGMMPGYLARQGILGLKATSVFPGNLDTPYESHQGAVLLFETTNGRLLGMVDATSITAIRTGAVSAVATDVLSRKDSKTLAILGSGTQASVHLEAMRCIRPGIDAVRVWSRNPEHAERFAKAANGHGAVAEAVSGGADAVRGADIICTVTGAKAPVLEGAWLSQGTHINAVGASVPGYRELDADAVAKSTLFVDSRESATNEADDYRVPKQEGAIGEGHIRGQLGDLLVGRISGRQNDREITLFKSVGLAIEDLAAADYIYRKALERGVGTKVDFNEGRRPS